MAFSNVLVIVAFVFLPGATRSSAANTLADCHFDAIYQFGDSISDTGNSIVENPKANHGRLPYGISMNKATGRSSDGLLIIDYIAQSAGLPLLDPYEKQKGADFRHGVNFAVAGVTALDAAILATMKIASNFTDNSLNVQLQWFDKHLNSLCGNDKGNCAQKLKSALFMVGEIGGNDYTYAFHKQPDRMSPEETKKALVPNVVNVIINATKTVIDRGAIRVVVPGIFPLGCSPMYLQDFKSNNSALDKYGCLKAYNDVFVYHNENLRKALNELEKKYPNVRIIYGNLYNAFLYVLDNSSRLGFRQLTKACCGSGGGEFNANRCPISCGESNSTVCANRNEYISWDGIHMTQETYKYMAEWLIRDIFPKLGCK